MAAFSGGVRVDSKGYLVIKAGPQRDVRVARMGSCTGRGTSGMKRDIDSAELEREKNRPDVLRRSDLNGGVSCGC